MKRARRIIVAGFTLLSLLVAIMCVAAWVRGYFASDSIAYVYERETPPREVMVDGHPVETSDTFRTLIEFAYTRGRFGFSVVRSINSELEPFQIGWNWITDPAVDVDDNLSVFGTNPGLLHRIGFDAADVRTVDDRTIVLMAPIWFVLSVSSIVPAIWLVRWRRTRRNRSEGRCQKCSYDLRASSNRCPECGVAKVA